MDVVQINGSGDLNRGPERAGASDKSDHAKLVPAAPAALRDSATISEDGRDTLRTLRDLVERLKQPDAARDGRVDRARAALGRGELDATDVFRAAAAAILRGEV